MNMLAEYSTTSIANAKNPQTCNENVDCAKEGLMLAMDSRFIGSIYDVSPRVVEVDFDFCFWGVVAPVFAFAL